MKIKVCDAIMGTGKSSAAITYMNEHKDEKFIYITPYLEEAERIKKGCPDLKFVEPSDKIPQYNFKKCEHTAALIKQGKNITTTHQAFQRYTEQMLDDIKNFGYRLIIDENLNILEMYEYHTEDIQIAIDAGYVESQQCGADVTMGTDDTSIYTLVKDNYQGKAFAELFKFLKVRQLIQIKSDKKTHFFFWILPPELITSFKEVFILTYLFEGQSLHHFLKIYNLEYEYVGIKRNEDGTYKFCDYPGDLPEYVSNLKNMIHILDNPKLNNIGDDYHSLSMSWFDKPNNEEDVEQLKKNVYNCINNIWRDVPANRKLWGSYKGHCRKVQGKGYTKSFLSFNTRATNAYRDREHLVYIANIFMNVNEKRLYRNYGIEPDDDMYALSIMVQWIWRSAIRDGEEVYIYIPSRRMRSLLTNWIEVTSKGGDLKNETVQGLHIPRRLPGRRRVHRLQ